MSKYFFRIYGNPVAQARPRFARSTGHAYTPQTSLDWRQSVIAQVLQSDSRPKAPLKTPVVLSMKFYLPAPKTVEAKRKRGEDPRHTTKPDIDNLYKAVADALAGLVYEDDKQICWVSVCKTYANSHTLPGCEVYLREVEE